MKNTKNASFGIFLRRVRAKGESIEESNHNGNVMSMGGSGDWGANFLISQWKRLLYYFLGKNKWS